MSTEVFNTATKIHSYRLKNGQICSCDYPVRQRVNDIIYLGRYYRQLSCNIHGDFKIQVHPTEFIQGFKEQCINIAKRKI